MKVLAISNNIEIRRAGNCQTKLVRFSNSRDAFGFDYESYPGFYQQIRLGLTFGRIPKFPVKEKQYRRQDGTFSNSNISIDKQLSLHTDYFDFSAHAALSVALKHDRMYIDDVAYSNQGEYEIEGDDDETLTNLTTAKTAILQQGYNNTNITC
jgi:hypothetical protein